MRSSSGSQHYGGSSHRNGSTYNSISNNYRVALPDPRPSRADPEHRNHRKTKEKEHGGFDWGEGIALALIGATALFSIDRQLEKKRRQ
ncbi:NACHT and TPR domain protein [Purpureocillium lavendulum]|uniref:NACHT and TPR domain protein n=1 Tax=Purpureocillium lavendulum TaxID=1247861 RepID=A0AB34FS51_9HYPO|nr:NACHT and TPR domain protein [Purpureocillium lavendulum]